MSRELAVVTEAQVLQIVAAAQRGGDGGLSKLRLQSAYMTGLALWNFRKIDLCGEDPPNVADAEWWRANAS